MQHNWSTAKPNADLKSHSFVFNEYLRFGCFIFRITDENLGWPGQSNLAVSSCCCVKMSTLLMVGQVN